MKWILVLISLSAALACTRHEPTSDEDRYRRIQTLIDEERTDEAESEARQILEQEPSNERARVILASIFAHRAGVSLKDFFYLEGLSRPQAKDEGKTYFSRKDFQKEKASTDFSKALNFVEDMDHTLSRLQDYADRFEQIPLVGRDGADQLYLALQELEKIERPENGNALYRGVIKLFYFKYLWKTGKFIKIEKGEFCSMKISTFSERLQVFTSFTLGMLRDISKGFPKSDEQFQKQISRFGADVDQATTWLKQATDSGSAATIRSVLENLSEKQQDPSLQGFKCDF